MVPTVKAVLDVETIRDGGSLAATFRDQDGAKWILFLPIDQAIHEGSVERRGFKEPALIDADPAKRPMDTEGRIHSELSGPSSALSWEEAKTLVGQITELAATLTELAATASSRLRIAIDSRGNLPPDIARSSPTRR